MLIGDVVKKTGLPKDTIRFYEKKGLIKVGKKERRENNYKEYSENVLFRLAVIKKITSYGFTLAETAEFLEMIENNAASCDNVSNKVTEKISFLDRKIEALRAIKELLVKETDNCTSACLPGNANCPIVIPE